MQALGSRNQTRLLNGRKNQNPSFGSVSKVEIGSKHWESRIPSHNVADVLISESKSEFSGKLWCIELDTHSGVSEPQIMEKFSQLKPELLEEPPASRLDASSGKKEIRPRYWMYRESHIPSC